MAAFPSADATRELLMLAAKMIDDMAYVPPESRDTYVRMCLLQIAQRAFNIGWHESAQREQSAGNQPG